MTHSIRSVCFCCAKVLCDPDAETPHYDTASTAFSGHPGFGSRMDASTAGNEPLVIEVCDDCLVQRNDRVVLRKTTETKAVQEQPWLCEECHRPKDHGTCPFCTDCQQCGDKHDG